MTHIVIILFLPVIFAAVCCMFKSCVSTFYHDPYEIHISFV